MNPILYTWLYTRVYISKLLKIKKDTPTAWPSAYNATKSTPPNPVTASTSRSLDADGDRYADGGRRGRERYADGWIYADGGRQALTYTPTAVLTPTGRSVSGTTHHVRRRPRYLAVGV